jgi:NYN domain
MTENRIALLIDADNLSGDVIGQAVEHLLASHGAIHFRRAYCSPQKVIEHIDLFRRLSIRPMVNVPTGKNSTDIALAVDAIDLAISERPSILVIASSDSDYAPLAQRLREKGCRVIGIGQAGKTGAESPLAYDEFIDLAHRKSRRPDRLLVEDAPAVAPRTRRASAVTARGAAEATDRDVVPTTRTRTARSTVRSTSGDRGTTTPAPSPTRRELPTEVAALLEALPALADGTAMQLGDVGKAMREHAILKSRNASPSSYLKRLGGHFELAPRDKPRTVRYLGAGGG